MAYILLALGALMSLVGLVAMATGYPMIEIERGWATVITGAVLFSGGLVVVALGLVVRSLVGLRGALTAIGALPGAAGAPVPLPMAVPTPLMPSLPAMAAAPPPFDMPPDLPPMTRPPATAFDAGPGLGVAVPAAAAVLAAGALHGHEEHEAAKAPEASPHLHEDSAESHQTEPHADEAVAHAVEPIELEPHVPDTYVPEVVHTPLQTYEPPHLDPVEAHATEPTSPPADPAHPTSDKDWLDQAFSAFDYEMANGHAPTAEAARVHESHHEPAPATEEQHDTQVDQPEHEDGHAPVSHEPEPEPDAEPHAPEPQAAEAPATAPAEPAANLAVIGRYDSEGTSYVMYSDGSIEAQSDAGVYRFGSMAELKAFIEG